MTTFTRQDFVRIRRQHLTRLHPITDWSCDGLRNARASIYRVLADAPCEAGAVVKALKDGLVEGSIYTAELAGGTKCGCLVGTISIAQGIPFGSGQQSNYRVLTGGMRSADGVSTEALGLHPGYTRPAEDWFFNIGLGDTPANNPYAAQAVEWIEAWMAEHPDACKEVVA